MIITLTSTPRLDVVAEAALLEVSPLVVNFPPPNSHHDYQTGTDEGDAKTLGWGDARQFTEDPYVVRAQRRMLTGAIESIQAKLGSNP